MSQSQIVQNAIDSCGTVGLRTPGWFLAEYGRTETLIRNNLSSEPVSCVYSILIQGPKIT